VSVREARTRANTATVPGAPPGADRREADPGDGAVELSLSVPGHRLHCRLRAVHEDLAMVLSPSRDLELRCAGRGAALALAAVPAFPGAPPVGLGSLGSPAEGLVWRWSDGLDAGTCGPAEEVAALLELTCPSGRIAVTGAELRDSGLLSQ